MKPEAKKIDDKHHETFESPQWVKRLNPIPYSESVFYKSTPIGGVNSDKSFTILIQRQKKF
jgi:hypothetical protein